jgi:indolepyruvate ferredoxin oxidoreductase beta subunit
MLMDMTVKEFLTELASNSPAPGGGSVSAMAGSLSAALVSMVANLTTDIKEQLSNYPVSLYSVDADREAEKLGNMKVMNVVLLGAMVKLVGLADLVDWSAVVAEEVKPAYRDINIKAFSVGTNLV